VNSSAARCILLALALLIAQAAHGQVPDVTLSYFVPQSGILSTPTEGQQAIRNARTCPNVDRDQIYFQNARLKIVVQASDGSPIPGIAAADICVMFNGGTPAQGFTGIGADSIIANSQFNPGCPDVHCITADAPTDSSGATYISWRGSTPGQPGIGTRDPSRKFGAWEGDVPLYVLGVQLQGKLTSASPLGSYTAHVKNLDCVGGRGTALNQGEIVNSLDINAVQAAIGGPYRYHLDFDNNGIVNTLDLNFLKGHNNHKCNYPIVN
jgi:hypothetical protein